MCPLSPASEGGGETSSHMRVREDEAADGWHIAWRPHTSVYVV